MVNEWDQIAVSGYWTDLSKEEQREILDAKMDFYSNQKTESLSNKQPSVPTFDASLRYNELPLFAPQSTNNNHHRSDVRTYKSITELFQKCNVQ
jgi:hypothetical protein